MKNNKNIYFLVPAVILIWGLIGVRIYKTINPTPVKTEILQSSKAYEIRNIEVQKPYTIKANYRDPFLGTMAYKKKRITKKQVKSSPKEQKKEIVFPPIIHKGIVTPKTQKNKTIFLIEINGKQSLLKLDQIYQEVRLVSGNTKEVLLEFEKEQKTFQIQ